MTFPPWRDLKLLEDKLAKLVSLGVKPNDCDVEQLRLLFEKCSSAPDAEEAIVYHGAKSLIEQFSGNISRAIFHRKKEISFINKLRRISKEDSPGLVGYQQSDLDLRHALLVSLKKINN